MSLKAYKMTMGASSGSVSGRTGGPGPLPPGGGAGSPGPAPGGVACPLVVSAPVAGLVVERGADHGGGGLEGCLVLGVPGRGGTGPQAAGGGGVVQGPACGVGAHAGLAAGGLVVVAVAGTAGQEDEQRQGGGYGERGQGCGVHGRGLLQFSCWVVSGAGGPRGW